jgi:hypothetical protein
MHFPCKIVDNKFPNLVVNIFDYEE